MKTQLTQSVEDYLKAIYELTVKDGKVSTTDLSNYLNISPASVSGMIKKLSQTTPPYLNYQKHQGVNLTKAGERIALKILRQHRLLEAFLHEILGFPWDKVHEEAEKLEHVISEEFEERIAALLGHPDFDPHGDPIPDKDLSIKKGNSVGLNEMNPKQKGIVNRVSDKDPKLLRYLSDLGMVPQAKFKIIDISEFDGNVHLLIKNATKPIVLGPRITDQIHVELLK